MPIEVALILATAALVLALVALCRARLTARTVTSLDVRLEDAEVKLDGLLGRIAELNASLRDFVDATAAVLDRRIQRVTNEAQALNRRLDDANERLTTHHHFLPPEDAKAGPSEHVHVWQLVGTEHTGGNRRELRRCTECKRAEIRVV